MRKLIIIAALSRHSHSTVAMAATYGADGVGTVAKGDVMNPLGLNEAAFQSIVKPVGEQVTFTHTTGIRGTTTGRAATAASRSSTSLRSTPRRSTPPRSGTPTPARSPAGT